MLVIVTEEQLLPPQYVCQTCLLADHHGQPRWHQGQLCCGQLMHETTEQQAQQYKCQMGFRIANVE